MDFEIVDLILRFFQVVFVPVAGWLIRLIINQRKENEKLTNRVSEVEKKLGNKPDATTLESLKLDVSELDSRLTKAETCLESVPSEKTLHELALTIQKLGGDLHVAVEKIEGVGQLVGRLDRVVTRHEDFLLMNGGK